MGILSVGSKPVVLPHGVAHMTPAARAIHSLALGGLAGTRRRKKKGTAVGAARRTKARRFAGLASRSRRRKAAAAPQRARRTSRRKGTRRAHLVKGSAAARRHMAKLRRMRKAA
jgi:hypothetical protein